MSLIADKPRMAAPSRRPSRRRSHQQPRPHRVQRATRPTPGSADVRVGGADRRQMALRPDQGRRPRRIELLGNPTMTPRGALRLVFRASDDHGVASAEARFALADESSSGYSRRRSRAARSPADPLARAAVDAAAAAEGQSEAGRGQATQDLTAHPWAGLKVRMVLAARDQAGQTGSSQPYEFMLPERKFTKPLAKAVVEQRKKLVREPDSVEIVSQARSMRSPSAARRRSRTARSILPCATPIGASSTTPRRRRSQASSISSGRSR